MKAILAPVWLSGFILMEICMSTAAKKAATARKGITPAKKAATKPVDLAELLKLPAQLEAGFQRILDKMTQASPSALPAVQTGTDNAAARLDALLTIFSGRQAQHALQDMLEAGGPPTREQLLHLADKHISARGGK
ncbi:hypothetical protein [Herbaspirillum seropedicae]|uniref:hypothetical protein n=1 Tax=Herbaspirillum seropedicae TaxID=964 RepID=UPI002863FC80|nr:hypothetical protein [Herbaspirillum seropedicae]MDR6394657.1 hypothetical protein [Herbaspirillum seropedicae]